jgi:DNA gyrase inhibitor GyrI
MVVDIELKSTPSYNVASIMRIGPYSGSNMMRAEFNQLVRWAKKKNIQTGKWLFYELDGPDKPDNKRRWEACLEIKGKARSQGKIKIKKLPPQRVARVVFNPDEVSARLVYHGLEDWLRWRKKYGELKEAGPSREVYTGNPWTDARAWAQTEVQVPVRKM